MDIDRFVSQHQTAWNRLDELSGRARLSVKRLSPDELDEMVQLYQRASAHLSMARTLFDDQALTARLSRTIGNARGLIYRTRSNPARAVGRFFTETFPAAAFMARRQIAIAALLLFGPAIPLGFWMAANGEARNAAIDPTTQELVAQSEFEDYYKSSPAESWAFELFTHNIQVSVMAFGLGALGGIGAIWQLLNESARLGTYAAVMHSQGKGALFWGLITPHGLIELTSVCLAAGAGLRIAWAMIAPGERTRGAAIADEGLRSVVIVLGTMALFVVAGFTEAFVTPSGLPTFARVGIGVLIEVAALTWLFGVGRNVVERGATGRLGEHSADRTRPPISGAVQLPLTAPTAPELF